MSIQYTAPGFEPSTSQTLIISHDHQTMAPALFWQFFVAHLVLCRNIESTWVHVYAIGQILILL